MSLNRVLVVDDDSMIRELMRDSLSLDFEVETADGAEACLETLNRSTFDAAILDLMMPKVTGLELFQQIREKDKELPVIILTAYGSKESAIEALRLGAHDYLEKPVEREKLIHSIKNAIERRRLKDENSYLVGELRQRVERLRLINQMGAVVAGSLDINRVLSAAIQMSKRAVKAESCSLKTFDPKSGELKFQIAINKDDEEVRSLERSSTPIPMLADNFALWVTETKQPLFVPDVAEDPRFDFVSNPASDVEEVAHSAIAVPLVLKDKVLGIMEAVNKIDGTEFTKADLFFTQLAANFVSVAIENANLAADLMRSRAEIEVHNRILEEKVKERTSELVGTNKQLEETNRTLVETQNKLVHSEKLASIGQLAAGVAHEINNPLGYIQSNLSTLEDYMTELVKMFAKYENFEELAMSLNEPKLNVYMKTIASMKKQLEIEYLKKDMFTLLKETRDGSDRVGKIVQGLKRFSHVGKDAVETIDINRIIEETLALANNEIKYRAEVDLDLGELPPITGNPSLLSQVFMNIIINAAQAIQKWGKISISTRAENGSVVARIKDTGCGIPKESLGKIFDPFYTTKDVGVGTGLGLSISYGIIKKHNGEIEAESKAGEGTTFTIRIPVNDTAQIQAEPI